METEFNFFAIIDETTTTKTKTKTQAVYYTNPNEAIIFGNFTLEECAKAQCVSINRHLVNYPMPPPPLYFRQPISCSRCGYFSHAAEKCVARRNYYGEIIYSHPSTPKKKPAFNMYPSSPVAAHNEIHYFNNHLIKNGGCDGDKTDYSQFVFTSDDIRDWIEEQHTLFVPPLPPIQPEPIHVVYVPVIINNHPGRYAPIVMPSSDQDIDYMLRYNYAMTGYMLDQQVTHVY